MPRQKVDREAVMREATRVVKAFGFDDFKVEKLGTRIHCQAEKEGMIGSWYIDYKEIEFQGMLTREGFKPGTMSEIYKNGVWKMGGHPREKCSLFCSWPLSVGFSGGKHLKADPLFFFST